MRWNVGSIALLTLLAATACKKKPAHQEHKPAPEASASSAPSAAPSASASSAPSASTKPAAPPPKPPPGPTAEAILEEAKKHVAEAEKHASGKASCADILPLLDVSYSLVRTSTTLDEHTLGVFAACAMHDQRWRLLRDLADAIAAGERKLETTYFLPRAFIGEADYEHASTLAKATLRAWPTEGEAYNTGALAALRVKDWDGAMKAADQALLLQHKHNVNDEVTAMAHGLRGAALLHMGKAEEGLHEVEATKGHEGVLRVTGVTLEAAHVAKKSNLLATVDIPDKAYPALSHLYFKKVAPVGGLVTVVLQNLGDKPLPVTIEVTLAGAENATQNETLHKGRPVTVVLTPEWKGSSPLASPKEAEEHEVVVTVTGGPDKDVLFHHTSKVSFEPHDAMPKVLRSHDEDLRSAFPLEASWVTPTAPAVAAVVDAAKARLTGGAKHFDGDVGLSSPQVQALWDELRSRSVAFHRSPSVDSEAHESETCRSPTEILAAGSGDSLESSVLFASLLEAIGLDVILVRTPGHRMVGWIATHADMASASASSSTVKTSRGQAYFLETTTIGDGPVDAAVLRGDATWVAATNDNSVSTGRAQLETLSDLRHKGVTPRAE
jgi:hypothetical protein